MTLLLLVSLGLTTAALAGVIVLFVMTKKQAWEAAARLEQQNAGVLARVDELQQEYSKLRAEFHDLEERTGMLVAPAPVASGLNLSRRTQAVRMLRRGDSPEDVAAALGMPRAEADLLAKLEGTATGL
jgi:hypothetical protein